MSTFSTALLVARKDLKIYFRDRTGMALGFLLPLVLVGVFSFLDRMMTGGDGGAFSKASLWIADEDQSERSRAFVVALRGSPTIAVLPETDAKPLDAAQVRQKIVDGEAHHALVVAKGFGETVARGELPKLTLLRDPDRTIEEQLIAIGLAQATFSALGPDFAAPLTARALEAAGIPKEWNDRVLALSKTFSKGIELLFKEKESNGSKEEPAAAPGSKGDGSPAPAAKSAKAFAFDDVLTQLLPIERVDFRPPARPKQLTYMLAHTLSGIGVMMLMFGLVACAGLLLRERESGTLPRLFLSPAARSSFLWGKFLFTATIGALQLVVLFAFGALVFKVAVLHDPATFLILTLAVLVAVTAFGMLIGTWAKTQKQADGISTLVILVMSAIGGAWFPLQMFEDKIGLPARLAMRSTLTHWAVSGYQGLFWYGKRWSDGTMLVSIGVLLGFAAAATALAHVFFERRYVNR